MGLQYDRWRGEGNLDDEDWESMSSWREEIEYCRRERQKLMEPSGSLERKFGESEEKRINEKV
jgi:hypothetical protein